MSDLSPSGFALFRLPYRHKVCAVLQMDDPPQTLLDINKVDQVRGFVMAPFRVTNDCPITWIRPDKRLELDSPTLSQLQNLWDGSLARFSQQCTVNDIAFTHDVQDEANSYSTKFHLFRKALQQSRFEKLVLASTFHETLPQSIETLELFLRACDAYPRVMIYLCYTPSTGLWLGASPEILLTAASSQYHTVALAGSMPVLADELPTEWSEKNRKEQQMVSQYVEKCLKNHGITPRIEGAYTVRAGDLAHLKTDFYAQDVLHMGELIAELHPTPAVCGLPKHEAYEFIHQHEGFDRRYYSGFVGMVEDENQCDLYVNLRCMQLHGVTEGSPITLYGGGGLLNISMLEQEWEEVLFKCKMMKNLIFTEPSLTIEKEVRSTSITSPSTTDYAYR